MSPITTSHFRVTHVRFLTKAFYEMLTISKERYYLSSKAPREKMDTTQTSNSPLTNHKLGLLISENHLCVSQKSISWNFYPFKSTWLSFKLKVLERKWTLLLHRTVRWHIPNQGFSFQSNTWVFLKKAFHEIFTL